ncbi:MAG: hypothetical protein K9K86_07175 [Pseudomonadales bacterium]|nr:hypothetical protein [Pseudomonadales bacterium]
MGFENDGLRKRRASAKRYHIPGYIWHITHQAPPLAPTRKIGAISGSFFSNSRREIQWTESVAVGRKKFVDDIKEKLGYLARSRKSRKTESAWKLREPSFSYGIDFHAENGNLMLNNRYFLKKILFHQVATQARPYEI